jgi:hypothetical protein
VRRAADPLERLRAANPVPSAPPVDWEHVRQRIMNGRGKKPRTRRVRLAAIGGASCAAMLAFATIAVVLLSSASSPSRAPLFTDLCEHAHASCLGSRQVGVLSPLLSPSVRPVAAQTCAVIGPRCARGCVLPVASPLRSSLGPAASGREDPLSESARGRAATAGQGCTAKTAGQPCLENVAGADTKPPNGGALRELRATDRLLQLAAGADSSTPSSSRICVQSLFRDLPAKRFPHRTKTGR